MKLLKWLCTALFAVILSLFFGDAEVSAAPFRYPLDTDGMLVIVIDPGHGGDNLGADHNGFLEKEMNMIVANAMYEELSKYEGVTLYLTHTDMEDNISIEDRAAFAASVNADFLFCLHFNMSPENKLFGAEVWISAFGDENREGYRFAAVELGTLRDMGLYLRGVKTRLNDKGTDYYGILRYCSGYGIPAALIEHCHLDHEKDVGFCDSYEDLVALGIADATSVAKYFGLKSTILGVDYADYDQIPSVNAGSLYAQPDMTDPDVCYIEEDYVDLERQEIGIIVTGCDYDTPMLYYSYSIDGGMTYTPYQAWPDTDVMGQKSPDTFSLVLKIPDGISPSIIVRGMNQYDHYTESNTLTGYPVFVSTPQEVIDLEPGMADADAVPEKTPEEMTQDTQDTSPAQDVPADAEEGFKAPERQERQQKDHKLLQFLQICLAVTGVIFAALFISRLWVRRKSAQRKKRNKKR